MIVLSATQGSAWLCQGSPAGLHFPSSSRSFWKARSPLGYSPQGGSENHRQERAGVSLEKGFPRGKPLRQGVHSGARWDVPAGGYLGTDDAGQLQAPPST